MGGVLGNPRASVAAISAQPATVHSLPGLPTRGAVFLGVVVAAAAAASWPAVDASSLTPHDWRTFAILAVAASLAQIFVVKTPRNQSYHTTVVFFVPAVLLLPPELVVLLAAVQHVPEWLRVRYPWYIQTFNIANYALDGLAAWGVAELIGRLRGGALDENETWALAGIAACVVFVVLNHGLLASMLRLARGHSVRQSGLFAADSLLTELGLASLGLVLATLWTQNAWLIPLALAPLLLVHRALTVPALKEEARADSKTGLCNARHFGAVLREELARSSRFDRPLSIAMVDLDLLREINNAHGHLAGDAVLAGIADVFRAELREYDLAARFGGEEFAVLLPETTLEDAVEIAERIRRAVADARFEVTTSDEPLRATISIGVASRGADVADPNALLHKADLAVYRAKLQGRNRVVVATAEQLLTRPDERSAAAHVVTAPLASSAPVVDDRAAAVALTTRHRTTARPQLVAISPGLLAFVLVVSVAGIGATLAATLAQRHVELVGLVALVTLVSGAQLLAVELPGGSVSVSAVGLLAGVALFGPTAILPLAIAVIAVHWSARRDAWYHVLFNLGSLALASLAAYGLFATDWHRLVPAALASDILAGLLAGAAYFAVNTGLLTAVIGLETRERPHLVWRERFAWLLPHYLAFGVIGNSIARAYDAIGLTGLAAFALPLLLMRSTMAAYLGRTAAAAEKLRGAAETIRAQNETLEEMNAELRDRSMAAMESLSATVDARDAYTAGHSRRVRDISLAIGHELDLSQPELDVLAHAALFHDIGKLAVPDRILLKPARLDAGEWGLMRRHSNEGARIIERLGFLGDAVPLIRHHHERYDGSGYPSRLVGDEIPLGARIIAVSDAFDSMLTTRVYRAAMTVADALDELRVGARKQFCPHCVDALEQALRGGRLVPEPGRPLLAAS